MRRSLYQLAIIVVSLLIINGLSRNLLELWQQKKRVERVEQDVADLEQKEVELKGELRYFQSDEYAEKIAREKLLLGKEGETVLLLPTGVGSDQSSDLRPEFRSREFRVQEDDKKQDIPFWKKWLKKLGVNF